MRFLNGPARELLLNAAGEGGTGGAGAGGGTEGDNKPKGLTEEDVGKIVNAAVTSQLKRMIPAALAEGIGSLKLDEQIARAIAKASAEKPPDGDGGDKKQDPRLTALEARYATLEKSYTDEKAAREAAEKKQREDRAFSELKTALGGKVRPEALEIAAKHLFLSEKRVALGEDGLPLLMVRKAPFAGGPEEDVQMPLADGVAHWLKTDEGKFFAPAPDASKAGKGNGSGAPRSVAIGRDGMPRYDDEPATDEERLRRADEREAAFRARGII